MIPALRSIGIPARYLRGVLRTLPPPGQPRRIGADACHAWLSAFCGNTGWIEVDPTKTASPMDHIPLAWGRDGTDVCPIQGVFIGGGQHPFDVSVDVASL